MMMGAQGDQDSKELQFNIYLEPTPQYETVKN